MKQEVSLISHWKEDVKVSNTNKSGIYMPGDSEN